MRRPTITRDVREQLSLSRTVQTRWPQQKRTFGHESLTDYERSILDWSSQRRLAEFQKANQSTPARILENKLLIIDTLMIGNGEILDILVLDPTHTWEKIRDAFLGGQVEGCTSTLHDLDDINYPECFWKAIIENERERLIALSGWSN